MSDAHFADAPLECSCVPVSELSDALAAVYAEFAQRTELAHDYEDGGRWLRALRHVPRVPTTGVGGVEYLLRLVEQCFVEFGQAELNRHEAFVFDFCALHALVLVRAVRRGTVFVHNDSAHAHGCRYRVSVLQLERGSSATTHRLRVHEFVPNSALLQSVSSSDCGGSDSSSAVALLLQSLYRLYGERSAALFAGNDADLANNVRYLRSLFSAASSTGLAPLLQLCFIDATRFASLAREALRAVRSASDDNDDTERRVSKLAVASRALSNKLRAAGAALNSSDVTVMLALLLKSLYGAEPMRHDDNWWRQALDLSESFIAHAFDEPQQNENDVQPPNVHSLQIV